jgi:DNA-binding NarL/FixJ family response regulator
MTDNGKFSVYLVAGNRLLREALAKLLGKKGDLEISGVSPFVSEMRLAITKQDVDVLVLDANSVHVSDRALTRELSSAAPKLKLVLIDMDDAPETFLKWVRAGVVGYFLRDASAADIVAGVRAVALGGAACPPQMCMALFQTVARPAAYAPTVHQDLQFGLTRRQQQLVPLIAQGFTNKEIASYLNISEQTVKNHIHRMLRRVGATGRLQVIEMTTSQGLRTEKLGLEPVYLPLKLA